MNAFPQESQHVGDASKANPIDWASKVHSLCKFRADRVDSCGAGLPRHAFGLPSRQPLVARLSADLIPATEFAHRRVCQSVLHNESHPFIRHTGLLPGHRRRSFRLDSVSSVTHVPGTNCYLCTRFGPARSPRRKPGETAPRHQQSPGGGDCRPDTTSRPRPSVLSIAPTGAHLFSAHRFPRLAPGAIGNRPLGSSGATRILPRTLAGGKSPAALAPQAEMEEDVRFATGARPRADRSPREAGTVRDVIWQFR